MLSTLEATQSTILSAGLSPAWQRIMVLEKLQVGEVNRARVVLECASGKVLNVGRAIAALGAEGLTVSLIGGPVGEAIVREFANEHLPAAWVCTAAPTRTCITLLDQTNQETTELVENAGPLTSAEWDMFVDVFADQARRSAVVVFSGSLPLVNGQPLPASAVMEFLSQATGSQLVLDCRGPELLACLCLKPVLVKPNRSELEATLQRALVSDQDLIAGMRQLNQLGAEWVLVTAGQDSAWLTSATECFRITPPKLAACDVVNPIGSGDCCTAGIAVGLLAGRSVPAAVRLGIAAAVENVKHLLPARLDRNVVTAGETAVTVEAVTDACCGARFQRAQVSVHYFPDCLLRKLK